MKYTAGYGIQDQEYTTQDFDSISEAQAWLDSISLPKNDPVTFHEDPETGGLIMTLPEVDHFYTRWIRDNEAI